ncbi:SufE family protein [Planctomicrobium sp. SH527]|uniref:SufE family protein n=1 Tax=Planctomicrobium sp. SH527 TaxID=3448123 RepID=UPI003F5C9F03
MNTALGMTIQELYEEFDFLGDWEERCDFLIDLGFELPQMTDVDKTEKNRVHGCQSNVWLVAHLNTATTSPTVEFVANSDAMIVNGLIAVLMAVYNRKTPEEIVQTDIEAIFKRLELDRHLSSQRRNGLFGMVIRIREFALGVLAQLELAKVKLELGAK